MLEKKVQIRKKAKRTWVWGKFYQILMIMNIQWCEKDEKSSKSFLNLKKKKKKKKTVQALLRKPEVNQKSMKVKFLLRKTLNATR